MSSSAQSFTNKTATGLYRATWHSRNQISSTLITLWKENSVKKKSVSAELGGVFYVLLNRRLCHYLFVIYEILREHNGFRPSGTCNLYLLAMYHNG